MRPAYLLFLAAVLAACTSDDPASPCPDGKQPVGVGLFVQHTAATRAVPAGYDAFDGASHDGMEMGVVAQSEAAPSRFELGRAAYTHATASWSSNVYLAAGQYRFYAYAPYSATATFSSEAAGAVARFPAYPAFSPDDLLLSCAASKRGATATEPTANTALTIASLGVDHTQYVDFKMNHLLARLTLQFYTKSAYADLRDIEIVSVSLAGTAASAAPYYDLAMTYPADGGTGVARAVSPAASTAAPAQFLPAAPVASKLGDGSTVFPVPTAAATYCTLYFVPEAINAAGEVQLTVTYNVFDKQQGTTRRAVAATNAHVKLAQTSTAILPAHAYTARVQVVPTYLYVLSDEDMQNPYIKL